MWCKRELRSRLTGPLAQRCWTNRTTSRTHTHALCLCSSSRHHGEPGPTRGAVQERLERRRQQQRRRELQGELALLHARAGRGPHGPPAREDAQEDRVWRPLVLARVLPSAHRQRRSQPHLQVGGLRGGQKVQVKASTSSPGFCSPAKIKLFLCFSLTNFHNNWWISNVAPPLD